MDLDEADSLSNEEPTRRMRTPPKDWRVAGEWRIDPLHRELMTTVPDKNHVEAKMKEREIPRALPRPTFSRWQQAPVEAPVEPPPARPTRRSRVRFAVVTV